MSVVSNKSGKLASSNNILINTYVKGQKRDLVVAR